MAEREGLFDIVINKDSELLFCIRARHGTPEEPRLLYDGSDTALLHRDSRRSIVLEYLSPTAQESLKRFDKVLIAEIMGNDLEREYFAAVSRVRKLPL